MASSVPFHRLRLVLLRSISEINRGISSNPNARRCSTFMRNGSSLSPGLKVGLVGPRCSLFSVRTVSGPSNPAPPGPIVGEPLGVAAPTKSQLLKGAVKDYGATVIVFHVAISLASLGGFYTAVSSGIDMVHIVSHLPYIGSKIAESDIGTGASTFVVAYAIHKCFAPVRISITLTSTPFIVNYLRRKGVLKIKK